MSVPEVELKLDPSVPVAGLGYYVEHDKLGAVTKLSLCVDGIGTRRSIPGQHWRG